MGRNGLEELVMFHPVCTSLYSPPIGASIPSRKLDLSSSEEQWAVPGHPAAGGGCEAMPMGHQPLTSPQWDIPLDMLPS